MALLCRMTAKFDLQHVTSVSGHSWMNQALGVNPTHVFTVPANVFLIQITACGGGDAGTFPNFEKKCAGQGGAAGRASTTTLQVFPGMRFEIYVGNGGSYHSAQDPLTCMQVEQKVFNYTPPSDTIVFDCDNNCIVARGQGGKGFCGGLGLSKEPCGQSGIASFPNAGTGFCDANGKWIGYGGGGGGGRQGGNGGCVYSNKKSSKPSNAEQNTGCGGGGSALVLGESSKHFLPGSGAGGYVQIQYER